MIPVEEMVKLDEAKAWGSKGRETRSSVRLSMNDMTENEVKKQYRKSSHQGLGKYYDEDEDDDDDMGLDESDIDTFYNGNKTRLSYGMGPDPFNQYLSQHPLSNNNSGNERELEKNPRKRDSVEYRLELAGNNQEKN